MNEYENKIELMNYLNVLWKRKWFIIIATFLFISATVVINSFLPTKWEVDAIIAPSKDFIKNKEGLFRHFLFVDFRQIIRQINQAAYNDIIATELGLDIKEFPKLKAEQYKDTYLVRISTIEKDVKKAKLILDSLCNHLKKILDPHADNEIKRLDYQIKPKEVEKLIIERKIEAYNEKIDIIKQRKQETEKEMRVIKKKMEELEKELRLILKKKNRSEFESLTMFFYSNGIQQSLINYNRLTELIENEKIEEKIINLELEDKERSITQIEDELNNLNERKGRINYAEIIKEPTSSISPVSPKRLLNVLIATPLGFIIFTMFAFFLEYIEKQKAKSKG